MHNSLLMKEVNSQQKLLHDYLGFGFADFAVIIYMIKQGPTFLVVEDEINKFAIFENLKKAQHTIALLKDPVHFDFRYQVSQGGRSCLNTG